MVSDITLQDIEKTIILLENLDDTKYFQNSSIVLGMIEALDNLQIEVATLIAKSDDPDDQEALDTILDG